MSDFWHGQKNKEMTEKKLEEFSCRSFSVAGNTSRREILKVCLNILFTINKEAVHGARPETETFPAHYGLEFTEWPLPSRDGCPAHGIDGILLLCQELGSQLSPTRQLCTETRQAQAAGEAGNGH